MSLLKSQLLLTTRFPLLCLQEVCTLLLAAHLLGDQISLLNWLGFALCLSGISLHVALKALRSRGTEPFENLSFLGSTFPAPTLPEELGGFSKAVIARWLSAQPGCCLLRKCTWWYSTSTGRIQGHLQRVWGPGCMHRSVGQATSTIIGLVTVVSVPR